MYVSFVNSIFLIKLECILFDILFLNVLLLQVFIFFNLSSCCVLECASSEILNLFSFAKGKCNVKTMIFSKCLL